MLSELIPENEAETILKPHLEALRDCVVDGWNEWSKLLSNSPALAVVSPRSRAGLIYDFVANRIETYFDADESAHTSWKRKFLTVGLDEGRMQLRFKKYRGPSLRTAGIPTAQKLEIDAQQTTLEGMAVTHVVLGYLPDELGVDLDVIAVTCSYNGRIVWRLDLNLADGAVVAQMREDTPVPPTVRSTRRAADEAAESST